MGQVKTKIELEQELEGLYDTLESIYDEADSDDPDIDRIQQLAGEAIGIEEEEDRENIE